MVRNGWRPPIPFSWMFFVAAAVSALFVLQDYVGFTYSAQADESFDWTFTTLSTLSSFLIWPLLCPLIYRLSRTFAQTEGLRFAQLGGHLLLSIVIAFCHRVFASLLLYTVYFVIEGRWYGALNNHTYEAIFVNTFSSFLIYWILVGVFLAVDYYRRARQQQLDMVRMENELNNAQLRALRMQLHPHFLFNTLHTISSLMDENVEQAQSMVSKIGYLLRNVLDQEQHATISLSDEMRYVESYLDIEQTRFRDRLEIQYDIADDTLAAQVPNLVLQPLVENAIKHGFSRRIERGCISVRSRRDNGKLELIVQDDGRGVHDISSVMTGSRIGLQNVLKRLQQMYGRDAELQLDSPNQRGFIARISIPFETRAEHEDTAS